MANFPNNIRKHIAIWETDNILTAKAIKQMWTLHQEVDKTRTKNGVSYVDVCLKVPSLISTGESSSEESYDYANYDSVQSSSLPSWLSNNDNANKDKNGEVLDSEIAATKTEPDEYSYYDYSLPNEEKNSSSPPPLPNWLALVSPNDSEPSAQNLSTSHYLSNDEASKNEREEHCQFVEELELICYEESLLEVWGYNDKLIQSLTDKKVIEDINESQSSRVTGFPRNITAYLGGIKRDIDGRIIGANGALHVWYTRVNMEAIRECEKTGCKIEIDLGSGEEVDVESFEWEKHLSSVVGEFKKIGMPVNLQASYLFGSIHRSALFQDIIWVLCGWGILMIYVIFTLGKPFKTKDQIVPVLIGILCIGLSVLASYGVCTLSGIPYGPLNSVLPVLLIALGVDDMYVILNAWDASEGHVDAMNTVSRMRKTLQQAGLAITVTSLTDVIAFVIGATTDVPALKYFCVYAAVGITFVYILQVTLFVAAIVLNYNSKKGTEENKKSCLPLCIKNLEKAPQKASIVSRALGQWVKFLLKPPITALVLIVSGFVLGTAMCQAIGLKQRFESVWLLPKSSDLYRWFTTMDAIFPKDGREGFIFFENVKFPEEIPELQKLTLRLKNIEYVSRVDAWYDKLMNFIEDEHAFKDKPLTKELFNDALSYFLFNEEGARYRNDIIFSNTTELLCDKPAPPFKTFKINFQYIRLENTNIDVRQHAMSQVREVVASTKVSGYKAPWALSYGQWETENVISRELCRNVIVVLIIVFVMTMILLASIRAALLVLLCVLATLLNVSALMHLWGLTINTVTCIALVLAIGICVDYAAHITHGFLVSQGSRKFRAESALRHMGPAVLHGGISTLLAFILLAPSDTFVFISYFKILTGVAVFGLYHALVLLPILLALLGPPPYPDSDASSHSTASSVTGDSHSCTTESTNSYPYTPSNVTPQSTTQNSPSIAKSSRSTAIISKNKISKEIPYVNNPEGQMQGKQQNQSSLTTLGSQTLENIKLSNSLESKLNKDSTKDNAKDFKQNLESLKTNSMECPIESEKGDNVLKLYISHSS